MMDIDRAIEIVARQELQNAADNLEWEWLPDITFADFERIIEEMKEIAKPTPRQHNRAMKFLEQRVVNE